MKKIGPQGFTLIELMITVAIVGILASIGYPSYQEQIKTTKQSEAQVALVSFASTMGQFFLDDMSYKGAAGSKGSPSDTGKPWVFGDQVPIDGGTKTYNLTIESASRTKYTLKATPVTGNGLDTYCINELGVKDDCSGNSNW